MKTTSRWIYRSTRDRAPGPALSAALLAQEAKYGPTEQVCWAYAEALPELLGDGLDADVVPLGFWRGHLTAAKIESPVYIPGLEYLQTSSPEVARLYAPEVARFKVAGREVVEALAEAPGAVRLVEVVWAEPFEIDAPFELRFLKVLYDGDPRWVREFPNSKFLIPVAPLDFDVWLCWDRDYRRPRLVRDGIDFIDGRHAPRDVVPEPALPPWAAPPTREHHGRGWAATSAFIPGSSATCLETDAQRWLLLNAENWNTTGCNTTNLRRAWREQRPIGPQLDDGRNEMATFVSLSLHASRAEFEWIGLKRLLRVRDGRIEQLTTDHDLLWLCTQPGSKYSAEEIAMLRDNPYPNVVANALPKGVPGRGECDVQPGDRFILVGKQAFDTLRTAASDEPLAERLSRGTAREVATWARGELLRADVRDIVAVIDADAEVTPSTPARVATKPTTPILTTIANLINDPKGHHGQRIRCRGIYHAQFEGNEFADAWFDCDSPFPPGAWLVDVEGEWTHHPDGTGHLGQYASRLVGSATPVDLSRPRDVPDEGGFGVRRYVPLRSEVTLQRRLQGWTWNEDRWLYRLGESALLPAPQFPMESRATITWMLGAFGARGIFSWELHNERPIEPQDAMPTYRIPRGKLVRLAGLLRCPEPTDSQWTTWPTLDGVLEIVPPEQVRAGAKYAAPRVDVIEGIRRIIGDGMIVRVTGEMGRGRLYALSVDTPDGPLDI